MAILGLGMAHIGVSLKPMPILVPGTRSRKGAKEFKTEAWRLNAVERRGSQCGRLGRCPEVRAIGRSA
jgi:hypothetical protein